MSEDDDFYIHTASTDSLQTFPENKPSKFTNVLPRDITFSDVREYEVCLAECSYNSDFYNVSDDCAFGLFDFLYLWPGTTPKYGKLIDLHVSSGSYESAQVICDILNELVDKANIARLKNIKLFSYNKFTRKFNLNVADLYVTILVKGSLIDILGLEKRHHIPHQIAYIGKSKDLHFYLFGDKGEKRYFKNQMRAWVSDAEDGGQSPFVAQMTTVTAFLVYADFVKDVIFGSRFTNVLRTLAIKGSNSGERVVDCFQKRMYQPLKFNTFNSITVEIRDFEGRPIVFNSGNFSCTFHFRRKPRYQ